MRRLSNEGASMSVDRQRRARRGRVALLLVDWINPMEFEEAEALGPLALPAARTAARLASRARRQAIPVVYANDNFGRWRSDFAKVVARCRIGNRWSSSLARMLEPQAGDLSVLKPRHSAFFGTPLEFLLGDLGVSELIVTGIATEQCVLATAIDACMRRFRIWVPADCTASRSPARKRIALRQIRAFDATASIVAAGQRHAPARH
jgi:nicotinamidase-related amidase